MMVFFTIFKNELRYIFTNRKPMLILFGLPLCYSLLFGAAYGSNVTKNIPTAVYDQDQTAASRALAQAFADSEKYNIISHVSSQEEMEEVLRENEALAAIVVPPNFSRDIKLGKSTDILVVVNASNLMFVNSILGTYQEIVQTFAAGSAQQLIESLGQPPSQALRTALPVQIGVRVANNPALSYSDFVLTGMNANSLQLALFLAVCTVLCAENLPPSLVNASPGALLAGKLLPYWLCSLLSFLLYTAVATLLFGLTFKGGMFELLLITGAFAFAVVSISGLFSAVTNNGVSAIQMPLLYVMPAFLFSGYSWPHLAMGEFARFFSALLPLAYAADVMRDIMLAGFSPHLTQNVLLLFAAGMAANLVSLLALTLRGRSRRLTNSPAGKEACL